MNSYPNRGTYYQAVRNQVWQTLFLSVNEKNILNKPFSIL